MTKAGLVKVNTEYKEKYGFSKPEKYVFKAKKGLNGAVVREISRQKDELAWMRDFRLKAYEIFEAKKQPTWGADLTGLNYDDIYYYLKPIQSKGKNWADLPKEIR